MELRDWQQGEYPTCTPEEEEELKRVKLDVYAKVFGLLAAQSVLIRARSMSKQLWPEPQHLQTAAWEIAHETSQAMLKGYEEALSEELDVEPFQQVA